MSFIASMVSAAIAAEIGAGALATMGGIAATGAAGAGLGAGIGALTGGDIGEGALMGGIGGALGGAGALAGGATAGAGAIGLTSEGGALASAPVAAGSAASVTPTALANAAPIVEGATVAPVGASAITPSGLSMLAPTGEVASSAGNVMAQGANVITPTFSTGSPLVAQGALGQVATQGAAESLPLGQQAMNAMGATPGSAMSQYGGSALQGAAGSMGIQGISNAVTGRPITEGMGVAGVAGGVGGAATQGLAGQAGSEGMMGKIGQFAKDNPLMTAGGIGLLATPVVNSMFNGSEDTSNQPSDNIKADSRWNAAAYKRPTLRTQFAHGGDVPASGISTLGSYSDGGRLLKGPGDGVSDSIPAVIGGKEPARLAEGEFVVPARIVSELGNGSTDAGAKQLYAMMDRIQGARHKTMGKGQFSENTHAARQLPA